MEQQRELEESLKSLDYQARVRVEFNKVNNEKKSDGTSDFIERAVYNKTSYPITFLLHVLHVLYNTSSSIQIRGRKSASGFTAVARTSTTIINISSLPIRFFLHMSN